MKFWAAETFQGWGNLCLVQIVSSCYPDSLNDLFR